MGTLTPALLYPSRKNYLGYYAAQDDADEPTAARTIAEFEAGEVVKDEPKSEGTTTKRKRKPPHSKKCYLRRERRRGGA